MRWSIFCRVVDNFGDIGFAWRLSADLASRGESVALVVDDARALAWMAPHGAANVEVIGWPGAAGDLVARSDVLVETFGCGLPDAVRAALDALEATSHVPVLVNVEHLSAEAFVERSHGLASPRFSRHGVALPTWFYYPGFSAATGGLVREPGLLKRLAEPALDRRGIAAPGAAPQASERCVSLFCYANPRLEALIDSLSHEPTLLLLTPGFATEQAASILGPTLRRGALRAVGLPPLDQPGFDLLLASCDLNFVRGEDSVVRAIWAGRPFVWQIYPQSDDAHVHKLQAFLDLALADASPAVARAVRQVFLGWNHLGDSVDLLPVSDPLLHRAWQAHVEDWRDRLAAQPDLSSSLLGFVAAKR